MNTDEPNDFYGKLTHQQQRFCDEYLTHFNAFKAAVNSGYSENTSRKGALLHVPKIQHYLKERMAARSQRLEITHDMILRELSKIAFSNMGNYYDEYACLKRMNELTVDEKAAIAYYDITEVQDGEGYRVGMQSRIKLHNKMSALDKIARHLGFYGTAVKQNQEPRIKSQDEVAAAVAVAGEFEEEGGLLMRTPTKAAVRKKGEVAVAGGFGEVERPVSGSSEEGLLVGTPTKAVAVEKEAEVAVVDRSTNNLPMDYPEEDFELEGIDLKTLVALEGVSYSPGARWEESLVAEVSGSSSSEWQEGKGERQTVKGF